MTTLPALLLMHGVGDDGACWGPFVRRLHGRPGLADLLVATPDAPAHGGRRAAAGADDRLARPARRGDRRGRGAGGAVRWPDRGRRALDGLHGRPGRGGQPAGPRRGHVPRGPAPDAGAARRGQPRARAASELEPPTPVDVSEFGDWFADLQSIPLADVVAAARADHPTWDDDEYELWARAKQSVDRAAFTEPVVWVHADTERLLRHAPAPVVVAAGLPELGGLVAPEAEASLRALPGWSVHRLDGRPRRPP